MSRIVAWSLVFGLGSVTALSAQSTAGSAGTNVAGIIDSYSFESGLSIEGLGELREVSQMSIPFTVRSPLGSRAQLVLGGGYSRVELTTFNGATERTLVVDGPTDVEARLSVELVPDRLTAFATGAVPTGSETMSSSVLPVVNVLVTDVLSFTTRSLGTGGSGGLGFGAAIPVGDLALGMAGSYTMFGAFSPVEGQPAELEPGGELRLRAGLEGPIALRTHLRIATIFSRKSDDVIDGETSSVVGNRISGYVSLDQGIGRGTLTLYAFDAFRDSPQIEFTALGPAALPRGNLLAAGVQAAVPFGGSLTLIPRMEVRRSDQAVEEDSSDLTKLGTATRVGADLRIRVSSRTSLVFEGDALFGDVQEGAFTPLSPVSDAVGVDGFRFGAYLSLLR